MHFISLLTAVLEEEEGEKVDKGDDETEKSNYKLFRQRLRIDITHYNGKHFLTVTDCGPTHFTILQLLPQQDSRNIIQHLEAIFFERCPPQELLADNDTAFSSGELRKFSASWGVHLRFRCSYVPAGNGIVEWCHCSIKQIVARTRCSVQEAVYWYKVAPKDDTSSLTAPANGIYRYEVRIRNIDPVPMSLASAQNRYHLGNPVWVKPPHYRCTSKFQEWTVTEVVSPQTVIVEDIRPRANAIPSGTTDDEDVRPQTNTIPSGGTDDETSDDTGYITMPGRQAAQNGETSEPPLWRSTHRMLPIWLCLFWDQGGV